MNEAELLAFCAAVSAHASLEALHVSDTPLDSPAVMNVLSTSALAINLRDLSLRRCGLSPASVPSLARLIRGDVLESLLIDNNGDPLLDDATAAQLADVLAASRTLTRLQLDGTRFWDDAPAATVIMRALTGHPRLQEVDLSYNQPPDQLATGAALGALVAANAPALQLLVVQWSRFGDVGLGGLCEALPRNTHLRELDLNWTSMSAAFARDVLCPAVLANSSLRKLKASQYWDYAPGEQAPPELLEAEALVAARNNGDR